MRTVLASGRNQPVDCQLHNDTGSGNRDDESEKVEALTLLGILDDVFEALFELFGKDLRQVYQLFKQNLLLLAQISHLLSDTGIVKGCCLHSRRKLCSPYG